MMLGIGIAIGLFLAAFIRFMANDSLPGRIVISSDDGRNPRYRWSLRNCRGKTVCNCVGSFADEQDARRAARIARRMMRGAR